MADDKETWQEFRDTVNMTAGELENWHSDRPVTSAIRPGATR